MMEKEGNTEINKKGNTSIMCYTIIFMVSHLYVYYVTLKYSICIYFIDSFLEANSFAYSESEISST